MLGWNTNHLNNHQVATAMLKDGWTCDVQRMSGTDRFLATVVHPLLSGGVPWPIEDPSMNAEDVDRHLDTAHPTYLTIGEAMSGAQRYVDILSEMIGYPDPHKMSARGDRPMLLPTPFPSKGAHAADREVEGAHLSHRGIEAISTTKNRSDPPTGTATRMEDTERLDKHIQILDLQTRVLELEAALEAGHIDVQFAILNRTGINQRWHRRPADADTVIFFDLDYIHDHNEQWGYSVTDDHIRAVMSQIDHFWVFRWYSGDEFGLLCAAPDATGFADRVERLLEEQGMTATFGIAPIIDGDLEKSMGKAASLVQDAKSKGLRGQVFEA